MSSEASCKQQRLHANEKSGPDDLYETIANIWIKSNPRIAERDQQLGDRTVAEVKRYDSFRFDRIDESLSSKYHLLEPESRLLADFRIW